MLCETGCEVSCETGCEVACETGCEIACELSCEATSCETGCEATCETTCETGCETGAECFNSISEPFSGSSLANFTQYQHAGSQAIAENGGTAELVAPDSASHDVYAWHDETMCSTDHWARSTYDSHANAFGSYPRHGPTVRGSGTNASYGRANFYLLIQALSAGANWYTKLYEFQAGSAVEKDVANQAGPETLVLTASGTTVSGNDCSYESAFETGTDVGFRMAVKDATAQAVRITSWEAHT